MARDLEQLVLSLSADTRKFQRDMERMAQITDQKLRIVEQRALAADKRLSKVGISLGEGLQRSSQVAAVAFASISAYAFKLASDAAEVKDAFRIAFGESTKSAEAFATKLGEVSGRDVIKLQEGMTRLQLVMTGTGLEAKKAAELVQALTQRAVDVGSLFNDDNSLAAFVSAITGEAEPVKKFGVILSETAVKAELLRLGFKGNAEGASEAAKQIARTNILLEQTAKANGNAADTAGSAANQVRAARTEFDKAARAG